MQWAGTGWWVMCGSRRMLVLARGSGRVHGLLTEQRLCESMQWSLIAKHGPVPH